MNAVNGENVVLAHLYSSGNMIVVVVISIHKEIGFSVIPKSISNKDVLISMGGHDITTAIMSRTKQEVEKFAFWMRNWRDMLRKSLLGRHLLIF